MFLFERFYRVEEDRARIGSGNGRGGAGLGLAIAREIALVHKGQLTVESKQREGATFLVSLPHS